MDEEKFEMSSGVDLSSPLDIEGGFSFGVFVNDETNDVEAVVFRLSTPDIKVLGLSGLPTYKIHFQWFTG